MEPEAVMALQNISDQLDMIERQLEELNKNIDEIGRKLYEQA